MASSLRIDIIHKTELHNVPELENSIRLQEYGVGIFNLAFTKSALKKAIKKQWLKVNGSVASTATWIRGGESIELTVPEDSISRKRVELQLEVLFEDEYLAVIEKPAGILVSGNSHRTIANALSDNLNKSIISDCTLPQPVHRLDYGTTGALLVGKTSSIIRELNQMFEHKRIEKKYCAITIGQMTESKEISLPVDGKESRTFVELLSSVPSERFGQLNLVSLTPLTGRRHQLRKHLSETGNAILGDKDYGDQNLILKGKGIYLHAFSLKFTHPFTREDVIVKSDWPEKFRKIFPKH